jgi:hypothetical protein
MVIAIHSNGAQGMKIIPSGSERAEKSREVDSNTGILELSSAASSGS